MHITYVLPVYNCESLISQTLESLLNQEVDAADIIVIDDASTDNTYDIATLYNVEVVQNKKRKGAAYCRNLGNSMAKGDIVAVTDCDVYYKNRTEIILEFFDEFSDKDIFYSALHLRDHNDITSKYLMEAYEWDFESKCPISHPTVAYRKKVCEKIKYKDFSKNTDLYEFFLLDAHKEGFKFGGSQIPTMLKVEGGSKRDSKKGKEIKNKLYKEYGIGINEKI